MGNTRGRTSVEANSANTILGSRQGTNNRGIQLRDALRVTNDHGGTSIKDCLSVSHDRETVHTNTIKERLPVTLAGKVCMSIYKGLAIGGCDKPQ
jgi:hypothetical protein